MRKEAFEFNYASQLQNTPDKKGYRHNKRRATQTKTVNYPNYN